MTSARESPGHAANVTVSARSAASAKAFGPRTAITARRMEVGPIEFSERRDGVTHLRQPLARCRHRKAKLAQFVLDPRSARADAHLEATLGQHRQRVRFPRHTPGHARGGIHPRSHPQVGESRRDGQRGSRRKLPLLRRPGARSVEKPLSAIKAHLVSPPKQISSEGGHDPGSKRSRSAVPPGCRRSFVLSLSPEPVPGRPHHIERAPADSTARMTRDRSGGGDLRAAELDLRRGRVFRQLVLARIIQAGQQDRRLRANSR